jgi:phospholipase C
MFVVSPWSRGGAVCSQTFDHTSVIQFIERRFGVREPNISPWRRVVCGDLTSAFDFRHGDSGVPRLPDTAGYRPPDRKRHPDYVPTPPAGPELPKQEAGVRPARPLPYELAADGRAGADGRLRIGFASLGKAGAHFLVSSPTQTDGPWNFTVGAGRTLPGEWRLAAGAYAFAVHGPNGFLREFRGTAGVAGPELTVRLHGPGGELQLVLANDGSTAVRLTVTDGYGSAAEPGSYQVRPGEQVTCAVRTERSSGWYDLTVTSDQDPGFLRRVAGHVETDAPSTSDPAIATV